MHDDEPLCLLAWSAELGLGINMNKFFEYILEFKAFFSSPKFRFLTVKLSYGSKLSCNVFGLCVTERRFKFADPNLSK